MGLFKGSMWAILVYMALMVFGHGVRLAVADTTEVEFNPYLYGPNPAWALERIEMMLEQAAMESDPWMAQMIRECEEHNKQVQYMIDFYTERGVEDWKVVIDEFKEALRDCEVTTE